MKGRLRRLLLHLYTNPAVHRLVPAPIALWFVALVEPPLRRLRDPTEDIAAERMMTDLLQHTPKAGRQKRMARKFLRERARSRELFWRPQLIDESTVSGREHWEAAHADGRPCVLVLAHIGISWAVPAILGRQGFDVHLVTSAHFFEEMPDNLLGIGHRFLRVQYGEGGLGPGRLIRNDAEPERLIELIETGHSVGIAFDVPGSAATPFLGHSAALASGPATLAFHTGVKVLPIIAERDRARINLRFMAPLDPRDFGELRSLRAAIARVYEPIVLAKPEIVEIAWYPLPLVTEALTVDAPSVPGPAL